MFKSIRKILNNECPNCDQGKVFKDKSFFFSLGFPKMYDRCYSCDFKFEKEPGFFVGAMYVSYALSVGEAIITFFIAQQFFDKLFDLRIIIVVAAVLMLLMFFNIRLSRIIWTYLFKNASN